MTVATVLRARLVGFAGLSALVGTRVHPIAAPQNSAVPFVTYRRISALRYSGYGEDVGIVSARYQIDCISASYDVAWQVIDQVRLALQRWKSPLATPEIIDVFCEDDRDLPFEPAVQPVPLFGASFDFMVHYRE